jgi:hypothetical protein
LIPLCLPAASAALSLALCPQDAPAAAIPASAPASDTVPGRLHQTVPGDALFAVLGPDLDELRAAAARNDWFRLWSDPEVQALVDHVGSFLESLIAEGTDGGLEPWQDPRNWWSAVHGSSAFFISPSGANDQGTFGFLVEVGEPRGAFEELLDGALARETELATESYAGVDLRFYTDAPAAGSADGEWNAIFFEHGSLAALILSEEREGALDAAHGVIDRFNGTDVDGGLDSAPGLRAARAVAGSPGSFEFYVGLDRVLELARGEMAADSDPDLAEFTRIMAASKLDQTHWLYGSFGFGQGEEVDAVVAMQVPAGGWVSQALALFGPRPEHMLGLLPAGSDAVGIGTFEVAGVIDLVFDIAGAVAPDDVEDMRSQLEAAKAMIGVDFEAELLGQLTGGFATATVEIPAEEANPMMSAMFGGSSLANQGTVYVVELDDAARFEGALDTLLSASLGDVDGYDHSGYWVNDLSSVAGMPIQWSFADKYLVVGTAPSCVQAVLARVADPAQPSMADDAAVKALLRRYPTAPVISISSSPKSVRTIFESFQTVGSMAAMSLASELESNDRVAEFVFGMPWPDPALAQKYLEGSITSTIELPPGAVVLRYAAQ